MNVNLNAKQINFKLNDYLSKGFELLKKDFGNIFLGFLLCFVMSIIPFCGLLAVGNFYKYLRKLNNNQAASPSEIFDFSDFMPYFILQLIIIGGTLVVFIPYFFMIPSLIMAQHEEPNPMMLVLLIPYFALVYIVILYFALKGFYIQALISFKGIKDIKTAWMMSKVMTKNNLINIFLFSLVVGLLAQIGIIACGIGIFVTAPFL